MDTNNSNNKYFLPIAVIVAGIFIGGAVIWNGSRSKTLPTGTETNPVINVADIKIDGDPFIGKVDAPVTIAFWSDYQCTYCKAFEVGGVPQITIPAAFPEIIKNYVDTGKVKVVFMDFAFLGDDSISASVYGRAIWKLYPDKYFEWRTAMYKAQDQEGDQGFGDVESIKKLTDTIPGIDTAKVANDVKENMATYQSMMDSDKAEAAKVGINATPSFVIGTQVIAGAYPYAKFQTAIDALLK